MLQTPYTSIKLIWRLCSAILLSRIGQQVSLTWIDVWRFGNERTLTHQLLLLLLVVSQFFVVVARNRSRCRQLSILSQPLKLHSGTDTTTVSNQHWVIWVCKLHCSLSTHQLHCLVLQLLWRNGSGALCSCLPLSTDQPHFLALNCRDRCFV